VLPPKWIDLLRTGTDLEIQWLTTLAARARFRPDAHLAVEMPDRASCPGVRWIDVEHKSAEGDGKDVDLCETIERRILLVPAPLPMKAGPSAQISPSSLLQ